jgi:hypothetical protein
LICKVGLKALKAPAIICSLEVQSDESRLLQKKPPPLFSGEGFERVGRTRTFEKLEALGSASRGLRKVPSRHSSSRQADDEQHQKDHEQDLCNAGRRNVNTGEAEQPGNHIGISSPQIFSARHAPALPPGFAAFKRDERCVQFFG